MAGSTACPICKKVISASARAGAQGTAMAPFCSARCRQVDLGRWLNEDYRVPVEEEGPPGDGEVPATSDADDPRRGRS